jgi:hypothetical protein
MPYKTPELRRANYLANKEKQLAQSKTWSKENRKSRRESYTKWAKANPDKVKASEGRHILAHAIEEGAMKPLNSASTRDWLEVTKNQSISNVVPSNCSVAPPIFAPLGTVPTQTTLVGVHKSTPFYAVHPDVAGRRNPIRAIDEEPITLGAAQELHPRRNQKRVTANTLRE